MEDLDHTRSEPVADEETSASAEPREAPPLAPSAGAVRAAVVELLDERGPLTRQEVQEQVTEISRSLPRTSIEEELRALLDDGYARLVEGEHQQFELTDEGRKLLRGIRALANGS